jgi:tetratricopeptide (TPR) repeat protein
MVRRWAVVGAAAVACSLVALAVVLMNRFDAGVAPAAQGQDGQVNPAARQEYLVGRYHLWRDTPESLEQAITRFERAVAIDPQYAAAYASLGHAWWKQGLWGGRLQETESAARAAAERALALNDALPDSYALLADIERLYGGNLDRAE